MPLTEHEVLLLLVQLVLLIGTARILGGLFQRVGQPAVVGELLAGVVLGPTIFGRIAPDAYNWVFADDVVQAVVVGLAWIGSSTPPMPTPPERCTFLPICAQLPTVAHVSTIVPEPTWAPMLM